MDAWVAVVGAGAAGLLAATFAAERGHRVLLLEKNQRPGLKILISGGGRCNVTTTRSGVDLERQYGERRGRWLRPALRAFPPAALRRLLEDEGVRLHEEDLEKVFPVSRRAADVLDALLCRARRAGVELRLGTPMRGVRHLDGGFGIATEDGELRVTKLVLATGGLSYPRTGATGDGYPVCGSFGHTIVPCVPALAPLAVPDPWVHDLSGIVVDAEIAVHDGNVVIGRRRRPVLFTHKGLSGPGPMDVSGDVEERHGRARVTLDFLPGQRAEELEAALQEGARQHGRRAVHHALPPELPERLRLALVARAAIEGTIAELRREHRKRLVAACKALPLHVPASLGYAHAEVTRGGIALDEIDPRTMESKLCPGLHVCGELLDIDGPIGGFNFQAAFATGRLAGLAV